MIPGECRALEDLCVHGSEGNYLRLADAVLVDWVATKILYLSLTVGFTDLQTLYPDQKPYYRRPASLKLFAEETQQFELLEQFYGQIGKLTLLEMLDLRVQHFHALGHPLNKPYTTLKELRGSVSADTEETKQTVAWREVVFMDDTFSDLRVAEFFLTLAWSLATFGRGELLEELCGSVADEICETLEQSPGTLQGSERYVDLFPPKVGHTQARTHTERVNNVRFNNSNVNLSRATPSSAVS
ncbi:MAG: hypothetical protein JOS17DRAFT_786819 [Linnemannia elongata]|nr:MAG: hypothetical protein JOS17DRAFT_786819 [Linnemannia elongata]